VRENSFAFLVAVICDMGITAERAWAIPLGLSDRLGGLTPEQVVRAPDAVHRAFNTRPKLHRFVMTVPQWVISAAVIVIDRYLGDAGSIWSDRPSAAQLRARFEAFPGIGQKKAAMATEILYRDMGVAVTDMSGSDVAVDVHIRRVFLRTGLSDVDKTSEVVAAARRVHPDRPGELNLPAWDIGRNWCRPSDPGCLECPITAACPKRIDAADEVRGA
jgi:uncharacterized HhH-GPD family protein